MITGKGMRTIVTGLMIAAIMLAAVMAPAYAAQPGKGHGNQNTAGAITSPVAAEATAEASPTPDIVAAPANGVPSLDIRYAVVEAKVGLMIGVMNAIIDIPSVPDSARTELSNLIGELTADLEILKSYADEGQKENFNAYIKSDLQPDMVNASQAIKNDTKQFKEWKVTNQEIKQLKAESKQLKEDYSVGKNVSAVASSGRGNSGNTDAYLNKAGIQHGKSAQAPGKTNIREPEPTNGAETAVSGT